MSGGSTRFCKAPLSAATCPSPIVTTGVSTTPRKHGLTWRKHNVIKEGNAWVRPVWNEARLQRPCHVRVAVHNQLNLISSQK